jgi:hypothetical protein
MHHRPRAVFVSLVLSFGSLGTVGCIPDAPAGGGGGGGMPDAGHAPPPGNTAEALVSEWSGCMTLDHFRLTRMNTAWGSLSSSTGQACSSCHGSGFEGFYAGRDDVGMFTAITTTQQFLLQYFAADVAGNKMIVNEVVFQAVGTRQPPHQGHPPFDPKNNAGMTALRDFYGVTLLQQQAHTCDPPRLTQ